MTIDYAARRARLMRRMGAGSIALLRAAPMRTHSRDVHWPYRQNSDFLYLTGFSEPDALAVLMPGRPEGEFVLFCRRRDPEREQWDGAITGPARARTQYGADEAYPVEEMEKRVPGFLAERRKLYHEFGLDAQFDALLGGWVQQVRRQARQGHQPPHHYSLLDHFLNEMRVRKDREEIARMRRSVEIACAAHRRAMASARPGCHEYELEAELLYEMRRHHMEYAYPSIVASGPCACVLHYTDNERRVDDGDLVLIDAGGLYKDYASDITRTWPVSGSFTDPQREIYELVLEAQEEAIAVCRSGNPWSDLHDAASRTLTRGLVHLGLLSGRWQTLWKRREYRKFFMHGTGHWLGMDVHDAGEYKKKGAWRVLRPGMVTTVEPGLYFSPSDRSVPKRYRGIGVRIEDNVAITRGAPDVLSGDLPRAPDELCRIVGTACG